MYFANEASKIYIMRPNRGVHHATALRWYEKVLCITSFAKHDVSADADIMYRVPRHYVLACGKHYVSPLAT